MFQMVDRAAAKTEETLELNKVRIFRVGFIGFRFSGKHW